MPLKPPARFEYMPSCLLPLPPVGEADPAVPAPTTSALMMLALGDALAAALWHARGFSTDDFSRLHPSGRLGVALKRVGDLLDGLPPAPQVTSQAGLREIAEAITRGGLGCALVTDTDAGNGAVIGLITDGDLRRALLHEPTREGEAAVVAHRDLEYIGVTRQNVGSKEGPRACRPRACHVPSSFCGSGCLF